uniref:Transposon Ty3-I Gag-Pol polyprotein n=1 Tax=Cajanus cajan TaxID=3821 RepID=A0A151U015_CAJCA|nr:Transposon Ty3-I Gag-Pol polyprotein [Cajanus cajan]
MLKRFGKLLGDLKPHNIMISDYAGKSSHPEGMILLDVQIGSVKRTTMFIVTPSKANFNVLLGREWIHGVGAVPSTMHQKIFFWNDDEGLEVLEADQKTYEVARISAYMTDRTANMAEEVEGEEGCLGIDDKSTVTLAEEKQKTEKQRDQRVSSKKENQKIELSLHDGYSGYNQIFIAANDVSKIAFRCPGALGVYEWVMMPFGLKNAGATYQRAMNLIFHDLIGKFIQVYIDDIIVGSKQKEDHLSHLKLSFERMRRHGLKMNPLKCAFGVSAGEFLGFGQEFRWNEEHQKAFDEIKVYLAHPLVLAPLSEGKQLKLYISASDSTIAGMLAQDDENGIERVIYYLSQMLVGAETRYTPLEKLCLSLYVACTKLKYYIRTRDVAIFCRSNVIKYMLCKPVLHS